MSHLETDKKVTIFYQKAQKIKEKKINKAKNSAQK